MTPKHFGRVTRVSLQDIVNNGEYWREVLYDRKVLVIRGLELTAQQFVDIHKVFGRPWLPPLYKLSREPVTVLPSGDAHTTYSNVLMKKTIGSGAMDWHRDIPFHRHIRYPIRSLYPIVLPDSQTSTMFMDCDYLWKISPFEARELQTATATIQSWYNVAFNDENIAHKKIPLVEEHQHTKRESILLNAAGPKTWIQQVHYADHDSGVEEVNRLFAKLNVPENVYEHHWELGDLVLFDNYSGVVHSRPALRSGDQERAFWRLNLKHYWQS